ncbi:MAG: hypothetical protein J6X98_05130 [Bacteroidales bacterium]|nr:hypothetical protein [Bacteroidales bacterium]
MKKTWITLIVLAMCATTALFAQEKNPKAMIQERLSYMKANVSMSSSESQKFWPVYEEFLKEEMKAMDTYRKNLEKQGIKLGAPGTNKEIIEKLSDKQLTYLQDQKFELRKNLLTIETNYHKKFKAILTPQHLQDLYNKEYAYKKTLTAKKKEVKKTEPTGPVNAGKKKR